MLIEGDFSPPPGRFAIIAARFNSIVVDRLLKGTLDGLKRQGIAEADVDVIRVPGSFEIPLVAQKLGKAANHIAIICLGAVIKGDTDHYDYVCSAATTGIANAMMTTGVPTVFGVLTCNTMEQALDRAGGKGGNKGFESAITAIEMVNLLKRLGS